MSNPLSLSGRTFVEHSAPTPLATWSTARDVWEIPQTEGLLCEHLAVFSETWPTSVSMRKSAVYEQPTWEPATDDSASSCSPGDVRYLPTPTSRDCKDSQMGGMPLTIAVQLLPTPTTEPATGNGHARNLGAEVKPDRWGDYASAIARHEQVFGRPAPALTEPGPKGQPRLSPAFVEFMMMLPAGWITDVPGVTRTEALKMLGNGVVSPQAVAALRDMKRHITIGSQATA